MGKPNFMKRMFKEYKSNTLMSYFDKYLTYEDLENEINLQTKRYLDIGLKPGDRVGLIGDYSFFTVAKILSLIELKSIIIPLSEDAFSKLSDELKNLIGFNWIDKSETGLQKSTFGDLTTHQYYENIKSNKVPGLVLLTSGTTGIPKIVVHDFSKLLKKFEQKRPALRTLNFLLFDHWGGLNTLLHSLSNGAELIFPDGRTPEKICKKIQDNGVELLPSTPSFLGSILITKMHKKYDLSSLKVITYGAEPMPQSTLERLEQAFPQVAIRQTYGMIELGVLRAKSKSNGSRWVKIGGEGYNVRVVDGMLQIKAESAMIGYLNAPTPYTDDGFFMTGDAVNQHGEWIEILGRASDIINVGGNKVYPTEVESEILKLSFIKDCAIFSEDNQMLGKIICANIVTGKSRDDKILERELIKHCRNNLQKYMVPMKIFHRENIQSTRLKRLRRKIN